MGRDRGRWGGGGSAAINGTPIGTIAACSAAGSSARALPSSAGDTHRLGAKVPRHVGLQMPGLKQRFGDAPEFVDVVAGINGSRLGFDKELATEITFQHGPEAVLQNIKQWHRWARPVSRTVPTACVEGFTHASGVTGSWLPPLQKRSSAARPAKGQHNNPAT